jgi:Flp pilus assembly protein TadD
MLHRTLRPSSIAYVAPLVALALLSAAAAGRAETTATNTQSGAARPITAQGGSRVQAPAESVAPAPAVSPEDALRALHEEEAWLAVASHLPDPATAGPDQLEMAGDVLRARRYPEEALEFYGYAMTRGGDRGRLLNKMGVTELALHRTGNALSCFKLVLRKDKKNAEAWNNLGAADYIGGETKGAVGAYRKAVKLEPATAVFHENLATALIDEKDFDEARKEFSRAMDLDPEVGLRRGEGSGISAHVLSPAGRLQYYVAMASLYAARGKMDAMLHWLAMASEDGGHMLELMNGDAVLARYVKDPRVKLLVANGRALQAGDVSIAGLPAGVPALPAAQ